MSAVSTRLTKEVRTMLIPWCMVAALSAFPALQRTLNFRWFDESIFGVGDLGFFVGIPLLACLSLGSEFRHKTLALLLGQPIDRMKIWREKWIVTAVAVLSLVAVAALSRNLLFSTSVTGSFIPGFLIATICAGFYWTLLARSTLGGVVLNLAAFLFLFIAVSSIPYPIFPESLMAAAVLIYSTVMLWLGCRKFTRFQMTGGLAGPDLMTVAPNLIPSRFAAAFEARPDQAVLNLIRKELRLLRPLWLISLVYVLCWAAVAVLLSAMPLNRAQSFIGILFVLSLCYPLVAAFLAGTLPLEGERECGVQAWHMTLPLSMRMQWWIKLLVACFGVAVCALAIPAGLMSVGESLLGSSFTGVMMSPSPQELAELSLAIFFFSFWSTSAVHGMTRSVFVLMSLAGIFSSMPTVGLWIAVRYFDPLLKLFPLNPFALNPNWMRGVNILAPWWMIPPLILAIAQTFPMFRRLEGDGVFQVVRRMVPLAIIAFVFATLIELFIQASHRPIEIFKRDVADAVLKVHPEMVRGEPIPEFHITGQELSAKVKLSAYTERWMRHTTVTIAPCGPGWSDTFHLNWPHLKTGLYDMTISPADSPAYEFTLLPFENSPYELWYGHCR